ncbi:MAG: tetratricopeptide repeat protein, partial [Myxococcota bacterium]
MTDTKFAAAVAKFMEGASFKSIELFNEGARKVEKKNEAEARTLYATAAERFEAFVKEFPSSEFAPAALYNSQLIYKKAVKLDLAISAANRLLNDYRKQISEGELAAAGVEKQTLLNLASYNEQVANYQVAADTYLAFVDKFGADDDAPNSLYNAGIFYLGLGDTKSAVKSFARYIKDFEKRKDVKDIPAVYLQMAAVYEDEADWKRAAALYGEFEKLHGRTATPTQIMTARYKNAIALERAGRVNEMREACQGLLAGWSKLKAEQRQEAITQQAGGYCAFQVLEPEWQTYKDVKIVTRGGGNAKQVMGQVKQALDQKLKSRDEIAKKYLDVLSYGNGEWGVAGLYRASEALLDYVDTLRNAPDPPPLANNPEALDLFRAELDNIAFPVEDEAIKALDKALAKAFELGIYSTYTMAIEEKLKLFRPSAFGQVRELPFFPSAGGTSPTRTAQR